jgi:hypothetical protein
MDKVADRLGRLSGITSEDAGKISALILKGIIKQDLVECFTDDAMLTLALKSILQEDKGGSQ